jgi:hypothetical protein
MTVKTWQTKTRAQISCENKYAEGGDTGYLWSRHLLESSTKSQDEIAKNSSLEPTSVSNLVALLSPD